MFVVSKFWFRIFRKCSCFFKNCLNYFFYFLRNLKIMTWISKNACFKKLFTFQICLGFSKLFSILQFVLKIQNLFFILKIVPISKFCSKILKMFLFTKKSSCFWKYSCLQKKLFTIQNLFAFKNIHVFSKIQIKCEF